MLKTISILVVLAAGIFVLSYFYKPSRLELTSKMVIIKAGANDCNYPYRVIKRDRENFSNLILKEYMIESGEEQLIFEIATVEGLYELDNNLQRVILELFDAKRTHTLFAKNGLEALQIELKDHRYINLFVLFNDSKEIRLLYGMSQQAFAKNLKSLLGEERELLNSVTATKPLTHWREKVDMLISSIDH
jgi:lysophospholipase L1-like esterase